MDKQIVKIDSIRLVRYADDFVILCKAEDEAERTMKQVIEILAGLKLRLNKTKTKIVNVNKGSFEFLGFELKIRGGRLIITPKRDKIEKFKETIRRGTQRRQPIEPKEMVGRLNSIIRGWGNYFRIGNVKRLFETLDCWIRTRIRTFIEKKKSCYANLRLSNYVLQSEYKLASLVTLLKPHSL